MTRCVTRLAPVRRLRVRCRRDGAWPWPAPRDSGTPSTCWRRAQPAAVLRGQDGWPPDVEWGGGARGDHLEGAPRRPATGGWRSMRDVGRRQVEASEILPARLDLVAGVPGAGDLTASGPGAAPPGRGSPAWQVRGRDLARRGSISRRQPSPRLPSACTRPTTTQLIPIPTASPSVSGLEIRIPRCCTTRSSQTAPQRAQTIPSPLSIFWPLTGD